MLDPDQCYTAVQSRDRRFDGWFVTAVRTTGIYCRPSCPAITPKRTNVEFHATPAAAQQRGFRACKRCRPDASPGSPEWNTRHDVVARAMRLVADGVIDREGVAGLARRLGYSERHLNRLVTDELGAGPLAIARAQRAQTARILVETTAMPLTDVAFAAGFGSVRQFNDTFRDVYATSPTDRRAAAIASQRTTRGDGRTASTGTSADEMSPGGAMSVTVRLAVRAPFAADDVLTFIGARAIPGLESWDGITYTRTLTLPDGDGVVSLTAATDHVSARLWLSSWRSLAAAVQRVRGLLDLDADPVAVDGVLAEVEPLRPLVTATPGRRAPGSVDPYETAVRAVVGQQVSITGARTVAGRIVAAVGGPAMIGPDRELRHFPRPNELAAAADESFSMPAARRDTIRRLAAAVDDGTVHLDIGADPDAVRAELLAIAGIGPWTADYVVMRGLGHPDTFLAHDLGVRHALARLDAASLDPATFAPWRSYAVHHLWAALHTRKDPS